jgi:hypothetical protein
MQSARPPIFMTHLVAKPAKPQGKHPAKPRVKDHKKTKQQTAVSNISHNYVSARWAENI